MKEYIISSILIGCLWCFAALAAVSGFFIYAVLLLLLGMPLIILTKAPQDQDDDK